MCSQFWWRPYQDVSWVDNLEVKETNQWVRWHIWGRTQVKSLFPTETPCTHQKAPKSQRLSYLSLVGCPCLEPPGSGKGHLDSIAWSPRCLPGQPPIRPPRLTRPCCRWPRIPLLCRSWCLGLRGWSSMWLKSFDHTANLMH